MNRQGNKIIHPVIAIDEGYMLIDEENPIGLDFIYMWYKRIRKYNGTIMFLTQNLSDILGNQAIVNKNDRNYKQCAVFVYILVGASRHNDSNGFV